MSQIAMLINLLFRLVTLDVIPRGYLTKVVGGCALVIAVANLLGMLAAAIETGDVASITSIEAALNAILAALAGLGLGIRRALPPGPPPSG